MEPCLLTAVILKTSDDASETRGMIELLFIMLCLFHSVYLSIAVLKIFVTNFHEIRKAAYLDVYRAQNFFLEVL